MTEPEKKRSAKTAPLRGDIRSYLKSASLNELEEIHRFLTDELTTRRESPRRIRKVITYTDGASRGNPGPAGVGVLLFDENGEKLLQDYRFIGESTNNEAEYRALLLALDRAFEITPDGIECFMDSELLVRQLNGEYAVKSEKLARFHDEVRAKAARFASVTFTHVPREHPRLQLADRLANRAIDEAKAG
jgi:ribonuclease HI